MKRVFAIFMAIVISLLVLFAVQNRFLFGAPFVHAGSEMSDARLYLGQADYGGNIGLNTDTIYLVRFYPFVFATLNVNVNSQGTYVSDGTTSEVLRKVNWVKWKWVPCLDRAYAVRLSIPGLASSRTRISLH